MSGSADAKFSRAVITAAEPQLFVAGIKASCDFFVKTLGFTIVFTYGDRHSTRRSHAMAHG
jgi:hypothetical protein